MTRSHGDNASANIPSVKYRVLGPLAATAPGGENIHLGGMRQRMVLAVLLAHSNRVVSQEALVEAVWAGAPPETGRRTLQTYISTLRRILGGGIERVGEGYILRVSDDEIDANQFVKLVDKASPLVEEDPDEASRILSKALGLWTGSPYGELGHEQALVAEASRLTEVRIAAQELRIETDLHLGRHNEIINEIEALVRDHPYREHLAAMLMLALYRCGRQADALRTYTRTRERLTEELGIDPSPELQDLELMILSHDPHLASGVLGSGYNHVTHAARGYELHDLIGTSQFGKRFRGFQSSIGQEVSVLVLDGETANTSRFVRRFESEMRSVSRFKHPHLVPVFDYWRAPEQAHIVTPYYHGGQLSSTVGERPWSLSAAIRLADQLGGALSYLHRQGYAHGAITTSTVLLDDEQNGYLSEAGLSWILGRGDTDVATDVFGLGRLVFEILTGEEPEERADLRETRSDLPVEFQHAVSRALHVEPGSRYPRVDDFVRALKQSVGLDVLAASTGQDSDVERRNPYKGLRAFQEPDAVDFHGRDALIEELVEAVSRGRMVTVVGASGSGKSSVVRAGLLPQLRSGAIASSEEWLTTDMFPGTHPLEEMERALLRVATSRPADLYESLTADARGLVRAVKEICPADEDEVLLLVDQFEELFSLVSSSATRRHVLDLLAAAANEDDSRVRVVLTLRADFFDQPLRYPAFAELMKSNIVTVSPPTADGLARAVSQPALNSGVTLEPGLVNQIVDDVSQQPGGLPLLQYALTEMFESREVDVLTKRAYESTGGVGGAIARRAEEIYTDLSSEGKEATRQLFLRLVAVDEAGDDTRRRVLQTELMSLAVDQSLMTTVIQSYGSYRLLSFDRDAASRTPTVELAHETILAEWDRLRAWIDERREDLLVHRRIHVLVRDWKESGRDSSYLMRGGRLEQGLLWRDRTDIAVSEDEAEYVAASVAIEQRERAERQSLERKATRRRRVALWSLAGGFVIAAVLGIYAIVQRNDAIESAALATARELTLESRVISSDDPELGILLALQAVDASRGVGVEPSAETLTALWHSFAQHRVERTIRNAGYQNSAISPDGTILATDMIDQPTTVVVWDLSTGDEIGRLVGSRSDELEPGPVTDILFTPDGGRILVMRDYSSSPTAEVEAIDVFDAQTFRKEGALLGPALWYAFGDISDNGHVFATAGKVTPGGFSTVGTYFWDLNTVGGPDSELLVEADSGASTAAGFTSGGELVVEVTTERELGGSKISAVDWRTGEEAWAFRIDFEPTVGLSVLSPDGEAIATTDRQHVTVYDLASQQPDFILEAPGTQNLEWSPDGSALAISGDNSDVTILDAKSGDVSVVLSGHDASVYSTTWHPSGDQIATVEFNGHEIRLWNLLPGGFLEAEGPGPLIPIESGEGHLRTVFGSEVQLLDLDGNLQVALDFYVPEFPLIGVASGDGKRVAGILEDADGQRGDGAVVDLATGAQVGGLGCYHPVALSWNGSKVAVDSAACDPGLDMHSGILDLATGDLVIDLGDEGLNLAAFSTDATFNGIQYVALNPGSSAVTPGTPSSTMELWSLDPLKQIAIIDSASAGAPFQFPTFSPNGRFLGLGTNGGVALVLDVDLMVAGAPEEEYVIFDQEVHVGNTPRAIPTDDGVLATGGFDGFYRLWKIETGERLLEIDIGSEFDIPSHGFSRDGSVFYYNLDGAIGVMPVDPDQMVDLARSSTTRTLTVDECRAYLHTDECEGDDIARVQAATSEFELAHVRRVTARFHRVEEALESGYELGWVDGSGERIITGCVSHPTAGAMGYHYFNSELMADNAVNALEPEALVYAPSPNGGLELVAVEWVVLGPDSNPPGVEQPPSVLRTEMHILVPPPGPAFYLLHAWVWKHNPSGMFADWNPAVFCD